MLLSISSHSLKSVFVTFHSSDKIPSPKATLGSVLFLLMVTPGESITTGGGMAGRTHS